MEYYMGLDDDFYEPGCPTCHAGLDWEYCDVCGGEGYFELYDEDPLYYDRDDIEKCGQCDGAGGWWMCHESHEGQRSWLPSELPY
jgi:hypothetical protein